MTLRNRVRSVSEHPKNLGEAKKKTPDLFSCSRRRKHAILRFHVGGVYLGVRCDER